MFNTHYSRARQDPELNSGETLVDRAGYISAQRRIENMIFAGQRLVQSRRESFDFPDGKIDESFQDPTRSKNYDMADATQDALKVRQSLQNRADERKAQEEAVKASQTAQKAPDGVLKEN